MQTLALGALGAQVYHVTGVLLSASGGSAVNVDFDNTIFYQAALFVVLMVVLKPLLFDPVLAVFEERERRTDGARAEAREMQERAGELLRKYEKKLEEVSRMAAEEREKIRAETAQLEAKILEEAREASAKIVEEGRSRVEEEMHSIRFDLGRESERLAEQIVERVLGKEAA